MLAKSRVFVLLTHSRPSICISDHEASGRLDCLADSADESSRDVSDYWRCGLQVLQPTRPTILNSSMYGKLFFSLR